ncbi:hypothetical protein OAK51_00840 [Alphaproteobacteria bacterium]|nr:hypothetical protein [Alphaproteobacteria bacterium]
MISNKIEIRIYTKIIACLIASIFFGSNAFGFFSNRDKTDYSIAENMFATNSTQPLFENKYNKFCKGSTVFRIKYDKYNTSGGGHSGSKGRMKAHFFAKSFGHAISSYLEGEGTGKQLKMDEVTEDFIPYLVEAAEKKYFTINGWNKNGSSPAYAQYLILINMSIFLDFADTKGLWKPGQRDAIMKWGTILYDRSHYSHWHNDGRKDSHRWPDTVSKAAAAYMLWGYVNKDIEVFKDGYRDFLKEYNKIPANGQYHQHYKGKYAGVIQYSWDLFLENKTIGDLVIASWIGDRVGLNTWTKPNEKGGTMKVLLDYWGKVSTSPANLVGQDERHLNNMHSDGNAWVTLLRILDGNSNPLVAKHLKTSDTKGYGFSQILTYIRCIANEVN